MSGRNFLKDRGLGDSAVGAVGTEVPWGVRDGKVVMPDEADERQGSAVIADLPNDYAARCVALEQAAKSLYPWGTEKTMEAVHAFHRFLTATEPTPEPPAKQGTFVDE